MQAERVERRMYTPRGIESLEIPGRRGFNAAEVGWCKLNAVSKAPAHRHASWTLVS